MVSSDTIKNMPVWLWKVIGGVGTVAGVILSVNGLSDYYWQKADKLVKGSVTQSTLKVTGELRKIERNIGGFLVDDIKFRIIVVQDEIAVFKRAEKPVPLYLERQLEVLKDQLDEAKEKWEK